MLHHNQAVNVTPFHNSEVCKVHSVTQLNIWSASWEEAGSLRRSILLEGLNGLDHRYLQGPNDILKILEAINPFILYLSFFLLHFVTKK